MRDLLPNFNNDCRGPLEEIRFEKMIEMDRAYVAAPSLLMDFTILLLTIRAVIGGRGAY